MHGDSKHDGEAMLNRNEIINAIDAYVDLCIPDRQQKPERCVVISNLRIITSERKEAMKTRNRS